MHDGSFRLAVFCGPSLPECDRLSDDRITYLPPASRGDVLRAAKEFDAVLLIDGVFHHDLAPAPKECYEATLHARMFGASSMGALRAAECAPYGFVPLGAIANWYVREVIDGDDEVAVLTHPQTGQAVTVPMVNVRHVARLAYRRRIITAGQHDELVAAAHEVYYMDRSWEDVLERAPAASRRAIANIVREEGDLKRLDARFALRASLRALARPFCAPQRPVESVTRGLRESGEVALPPQCPKAPGTFDRSISYSETAAFLPELRERFGITRVADITRLDRAGVHVFSAFVPRSPDLLGVYNGKGLTREASIASAVMEAAERQIAANVCIKTFEESISRIAEKIDLKACFTLESVSGDTRVPCVLGTDLLNDAPVAVPVAMVQCPWFGEKLFDVTSTNGLASGNNSVEAIYHALCELIERHSWAMVHVRSSLAPRLFGGAVDCSIAPEIRLPTRDACVDGILESIASAGLSVRAFLLEEAPLPPAVFVSVVEDGAEPPMAHMGMGCSLSPVHALSRALTEALQSRAIDIQGAREDMLRAYDPPNRMGEHGRRLASLPEGCWYLDLPAKSLALQDLPDRSTNDLSQDLRLTLEALSAYGIRSAIAVELAPTDLPISVVRAIVPGLETLMFSNRLGQRARAALNPFAVI